MSRAIHGLGKDANNDLTAKRLPKSVGNTTSPEPDRDINMNQGDGARWNL